MKFEAGVNSNFIFWGKIGGIWGRAVLGNLVWAALERSISVFCWKCGGDQDSV